MSARSQAVWGVLSALLLLGTAGCADNVTQVVVSVDAESAWLSDRTTVQVVVRGAPAGDAGFEGPSRDVTLNVGEGESYAFPIDVTVAPLDGDTSRRWSVDATAVNTVTNATATVRVRGTYVSGRTLRVALLLENTCAGVVCATDQTCRAGICVDSAMTQPVDAGVDLGVDAGMDLGSSDAATDGEVGDSAVPLNCPDPDVRIPNPLAGTLDDLSDGGMPASYPALVTCNVNHAPGALCGATADPTDICYTARSTNNVAYCRTPCTQPVLDGGFGDDPVCATIHPDSRCIRALGNGTDPDRMLCSIPCNPFDDVGCPVGLHCMAINDSADGTFSTTCLALDDDPRHQNEPCAIVDGEPYPSFEGCAPGYVCGYDAVCDADSPAGNVCLQICDADPDNPRVACPANATCARLANGSYDDAIGPIIMGRCLL